MDVTNYHISKLKKMSRSLKKGPYIEAKLEAKVMAIIGGKSKKTVIKTWSRRSTITPDFVGQTFAVPPEIPCWCKFT